MTPRKLKSTIQDSGTAYLTLFNTLGEHVVVGNIHKMHDHDGRLSMMWKLDSVKHVSAFDRYMVHDGKKVYHADTIVPIRLDMGLHRFDVELDL